MPGEKLSIVKKQLDNFRQGVTWAKFIEDYVDDKIKPQTSDNFSKDEYTAPFQKNNSTPSNNTSEKTPIISNILKEKLETLKENLEAVGATVDEINVCILNLNQYQPITPVSVSVSSISAINILNSFDKILTQKKAFTTNDRETLKKLILDAFSIKNLTSPQKSDNCKIHQIDNGIFFVKKNPAFERNGIISLIIQSQQPAFLGAAFEILFRFENESLLINYKESLAQHKDPITYAEILVRLDRVNLLDKNYQAISSFSADQQRYIQNELMALNTKHVSLTSESLGEIIDDCKKNTSVEAYSKTKIISSASLFKPEKSAKVDDCQQQPKPGFSNSK